MKKVAEDIWLIESAFPDQLAKKIVEKIDRTGVSNYMSLENDLELMTEFDLFWKEKMDDLIFDYFYESTPEGSSLYNHTAEEKEDFKRNIAFEWKNVYALHYYRENTRDLPNFVHADFSNFTFSCGLLDSNSFEGGDLVFPKQNYRKKIERLDVLLFPGGVTHPHYTDSVTSGRRINIIGQSKHFEWSKMRYEK